MAITTPTYLLAKYFNPIFSPLTTKEFTVKNSFDFAEEDVNFDHNIYIASLGVESLFTNIPLEKTIKNCVNNLFSNKFFSGKLSRKDLYDILKPATTESSFIFDNQHYKQIDGVAIGSPLGPTLANAFLSHYEKIWLNDCSSQFKPVVYRHYIDDIFVLFNSKEYLKHFANYMNSKDKNINFTFGTEDSNNFSFLDVKITRYKNSLLHPHTIESYACINICYDIFVSYGFFDFFWDVLNSKNIKATCSVRCTPIVTIHI